jgi:hypothetical protein
MEGTAVLYVAAALLAAGPTTAPAEKAQPPQRIRLRSDFPPGRYVLNQKMKTVNTVTRPDAPPHKQTMNQQMQFSVDASKPDAEGTRTVIVRLTRIRQVTEIGALRMAYDSDKPAKDQNPELVKLLGPMRNTKITSKVNAEGKIVSVSGLGEMWDALARGVPGNAERAMLRQMKESMGDRWVKDILGQASEFMPAKPVAVGETWRGSFKMKVPFVGEVNYTFDCRLDEIAHEEGSNRAVVSLRGSVDRPGVTTTKIGPTTVHVSQVRIRQTGTFVIDVDSGLPLRQQLDQHASMALARQGTAPDEAVRSDVLMTMVQTVEPRAAGDPKDAPEPTTGPAAKTRPRPAPSRPAAGR